MDFNERLEKSHARMDELKAKIAASGEKAKKARETEAAVLEAAAEIAEYNEKYGESDA